MSENTDIENLTEFETRIKNYFEWECSMILLRYKISPKRCKTFADKNDSILYLSFRWIDLLFEVKSNIFNIAITEEGMEHWELTINYAVKMLEKEFFIPRYKKRIWKNQNKIIDLVIQ